MNCRGIQDDLELHALGGLSPARAAAVEVHLTVCAACRHRAQEYADLTDRLRGVSSDRSATALQRKIKSAVRDELRTANRRRLLRPIFWSSVAAAAGLLIVAAVALRPGPSDVPTAEVAVGPVVERLPPPAEESEAPVHPSTRADLRQWHLDADTMGCLSADGRRVFTLVRSGPARIALAALEGETGKPLWQYSLESLGARTRLCRPVALPENRVCWTNGSDIHMLDAATGKLLWQFHGTDEGPLSAVAANGERLLAASCRAVLELDARTGRQTARYPLPEELEGSGRPIVGFRNGNAIVVETRSLGPCRILCVDLSDGQVRWARRLARVYDVLACEEGLFIRGRGVQRLDDATGETLWTRAAGGCGALTLADGVLTLVDSGESTRLVALDPRSGREVWSAPSMPSCEAFVRVDGAGYLRTTDGTIHVLALGRM